MSSIEIRVPDIGDFTGIPVIEILVKPGDKVAKNDSLITLESEKAAMEVPSDADGVIESVRVKLGDKVSKGTVIATLTTADAAAPAAAPAPTPAAASAPVAAPATTVPAPTAALAPTSAAATPPTHDREASSSSEPTKAQAQEVHASPAIRKFARELGVELGALTGSGPHARITRDDLQDFVKSALRGAPSTGAQNPAAIAGLPPWPKLDFAQFGPTERVALPRIKRLSGPNLHRNWVSIPHITNYDRTDVTDLEAFRNEVNADQAKRNAPKLTMLAFLMKACVVALQRFPEFNASLDGDAYIYKHYYNIGFAADTPGGLVVPVLRDVNHKGLLELAAESAELAGKARDGKLALAHMQGGSFTISSIGGIGGTAFTQIVNAPEVAILGAARTSIEPIWNGSEFRPRVMLPISVSYDHRAIDGAGAARFLHYLASVLSDLRRILL